MTGLLIDDDPLVVQTIGHFVEKCGLVAACQHAGEGAEAINRLAARRFDFVLLDLHLPDLPGQSVLDAIPADVPVIVVSSDPGFAAASYRFSNIIDYLVKPIDYAGFHRAMERVAAFRLRTGAPSVAAPAATAASQVIFVRSGNDILRLLLDEIRFVKSEANYVSFHAGPGTRAVMSLTTLKRIVDELPPNFLRVHRSFVVNRDHIEKVEGQAVHLGGMTIPIGDSYRTDFLERLGIIA